MKNLSIIFILLSFCIVFFSSCKKEEEAEPSVREKLIGKWSLESINYDIYDENGEFKETIILTFPTSFREFKSDGMYDLVNTSSNAPDLGDDGTWELIDNDTKIRVKDGEDRYPQIEEEITELTDKKLIVYYEIESTSPETSKIQYTATYNKE